MDHCYSDSIHSHVEKEFVINVILTGVVYPEVFLWYLFWVLYCSNFVHHNFSSVVKPKMKIFAGDIILYREVSTHKACALLQEDFNHVFDWLGSGKCKLEPQKHELLCIFLKCKANNVL